MKILAIETSCDETGVALIETDGKNRQKLLADFLSSQIKIHAPFGGVVPMLAKREHQRNLLPVLKKALGKSKLLEIFKSQIPIFKQIPKLKTQNLKLETLKLILDREPELLKKLEPFLKQYAKPDIDAIAVTIGPGLEPALWVGVNFARALAYFWNLPIIPVNHIEGHIAANWLEPIGGNSKSQIPISLASRDLAKPDKQITNYKIQRNIEISKFPIVCLVVSGGHTQLVLMKKFGRYKIMGETRDDAAGEAFDKLAKMLNLGYPGGPAVANLATKFQVLSFHPTGGLPQGDKFQVKFPRPMLNFPDYDFSFSGLKTAALYFIKSLNKKTRKKLTPAICAEFQQAIIDVLVKKTIRAAKEFGAKTVMLAGGVAANALLRENLKLALVPSSGRGETYNLKLNFSVPQKNYCTDNAAMIALAAAFKNKAAQKSWRAIKAEANLRLR